MTVIGFVRHGVTDWNLEGRAQGSHDVPLNAEGIRQAEQAAGRLAAEPWDYIYASDLSRARKTAELIAAAKGMPVAGLDVRLREKTHGRLDGTTEQERVNRWGPGWRDMIHDEEPLDQVLARGKQFIDEVSAKHAGSRILIVSHGAWIRTILAGLVHDLEIKPIYNTSLSVVRQRADSGWDCIMFNCTNHLESV